MLNRTVCVACVCRFLLKGNLLLQPLHVFIIIGWRRLDKSLGSSSSTTEREGRHGGHWIRLKSWQREREAKYIRREREDTHIMMDGIQYCFEWCVRVFQAKWEEEDRDRMNESSKGLGDKQWSSLDVIDMMVVKGESVHPFRSFFSNDSLFTSFS
jgi:hypothetical protein